VIALAGTTPELPPGLGIAGLTAPENRLLAFLEA
jgi:hypothetical protein